MVTMPTVSDVSDPGGYKEYLIFSLTGFCSHGRRRQLFTCCMPFIDEIMPDFIAGTNTQRNGVIVLDLSTRPDDPTVIINQVLPSAIPYCDVYMRNNIMYALMRQWTIYYNCTR